MASAAQIKANRSNARKSTGPRTPEGKDRASKNAVKHGLLAREAVIAGEDLQEYELHRAEMLETLAPVGPLETMLAERIVELQWRLRRAARLHNAAFAALDDGEPMELLEARHEEWKRLKGSERDQGLIGAFDEQAALAKVVVEDFGCARVLERLLVYERRIESSLYRTMAQLRRERQARTTASHEAAASAELGSFRRETPGGEGQVSRCDLSRSIGAVTPVTGQEPGPGAELGSFGANAIAEGAPRVATAYEGPAGAAGRGSVRSNRGKRPMGANLNHGPGSGRAGTTGTPHGVTTNPQGDGNHVRDARATAAAEDRCAKRTQFRERGRVRMGWDGVGWRSLPR